VHRRTTTAICAVGATLGLAGLAEAAGTLTVHNGLYGAKETLVDAHRSAAVNVIAFDHGKKLKGVGVACSSGPEPGQGIPRETTLTLHVPGTLTITHNGTFSYSGEITLTPEDTQSEAGAKSTMTIKGTFARGTVKLRKTTALTGTVSASVCASTTPARFSLVWATPSG
jgi:hypothetical protein